MVTVNESIKSLILATPHQVSNRSEALHFILCVLGNGYRWDENGEVIYDGHDDGLKPWNPEDRRKTWDVLTGSIKNPIIVEKIIMDFEAGFVQQDIEAREVIFTIYERMELVADVPNFYGQTGAALLMTVPDNVTEDWAEAVEEIKVQAIQNGWKF